MDAMKINHNNVSHTERLGLIIKDKEQYKLSPLGIELFENKINFESVFKRQMLRYFSIVDDKSGRRILFPYRACLKILLQVKSINFVEFVFGLYSLVDYSDDSIDEAIENIRYLRQHYPNLEILNEANKATVLKELNEYFGTSFSATDIWAKKTTIVNQYIYFRNHLSLFVEFVNIEDKTRTITLAGGGEKSIQKLLLKDELYERLKDGDSLTSQYIKGLIIFALFSL